MLKNIAITKLYPNPNNPRKEFRNIDELTESVKVNGILQPLTIVPYGATSEYTIVIGHCRFRAALAAGLETVPCIIQDWDEKKQLEIMLTENVQRNDLTLTEEAEGYQMMLDLGATMQEVADTIGKSRSYVRRRIKLLSYDPETLSRSIERGATMQDYEKLDKIRDEENRAQLLEEIGTSNFQWDYERMLNAQERDEERNEIKKYLEESSIEFAEDTSDMCYITTVTSVQDCVDLVGNPEYDKYELYYNSPYGAFMIYRSFTDEEKARDAAKEEKDRQKQAERDGRLERLNELSEFAYSMRLRHVTNMNNNDCMKYSAAIESMELYALTHTYQYTFSKYTFNKIFSLEDDGKDISLKRLAALAQCHDVSVLRMRFILCYCILEEKNFRTYDWRGDFSGTQGERLKLLYSFLSGTGYDVSDAEKALCDGTHEVYCSES